MTRHARHPARPLARRAFTMIEVLVVIVILVILLALITNVVKRLMIQSQNEQTRADLTIVYSAIQRYYDEKKVYPGTLADLFNVGSCRNSLANTTCLTSAGILTDGFGNVVVYDQNGPGKRPRLVSQGSDKIVNTKDDVIVP